MRKSRTIYNRLVGLQYGSREPGTLPSKTALLSPDVDPSGREVVVEGNPRSVPPRPSTANRLPPLRSRGSCRGIAVDPRTNRAHVYESILEHDVLKINLTDPRVDEVLDQLPTVAFVSSDGRRRRHTFDIMAIINNRFALGSSRETRMQEKQDE